MLGFKRKSKQGTSTASLGMLEAYNKGKKAGREEVQRQLDKEREAHAALDVSGSVLPPSQPNGVPGVNDRAVQAARSYEAHPEAPAQFFQQMQQYETWRMTVYEAEQRKRASIAQEVEARVREEMESIGDEETDPIMQMAAKKLVDLLGSPQAPLVATAAPVVPVAPPSPPAAPSPTPAQIAPDPDEPITDEEADDFADLLEEHYQSMVDMAHSGKLSEGDSIQMLKTQAQIKEQDARKIYDAIMRRKEGEQDEE